jgi:recombination protein RecA
MLYGPTNVGKSYLASQVVARAQELGGVAAWIDTELSWDSSWYAKCGLDVENILVSQPSSGEKALETVRKLMDAKVDVIVLDSIAGLVPEAVMEEGFDYNPMAWQARFINTSLPRLLAHLKEGSAFVAINQVRSSMGPVALDAMPGGMAQTFFSHFLLQVRRKGWIEEGKDKKKVGFDMEVRLRKTKAGGENWKSAIIPFRVEGGIDVTESFIREALEMGVVTKAGPWYSYQDAKVMGMNGLKNYFLENPLALDGLKNAVSA